MVRPWDNCWRVRSVRKSLSYTVADATAPRRLTLGYHSIGAAGIEPALLLQRPSYKHTGRIPDPVPTSTITHCCLPCGFCTALSKRGFTITRKCCPKAIGEAGLEPAIEYSAMGFTNLPTPQICFRKSVKVTFCVRADTPRSPCD